MKAFKKCLTICAIIFLLCSCFSGKGIKLGDTISTDFYEMSVEEVGWTDEINPTNPDGVYSYSADVDNEKYFYIKGVAKNDCVEEYNTDNIGASVVFDGRYKYKNSYFQYDYNGDLERSIKPLATSNYIIYFSVPDDLYNQYNKCEIKIFFNKNLDKTVYDSSDADYVYTLVVEK